MIRNLKAMGVAVVAVLALTAVAASGASAAEFHSESATTFFTGEQSTQNVFTVTGGTVKCETAKFAGSAAAKTVASVEVHPTYSGCTGFGQNVEVNTGSCNYKLTASSATAGAATIVCSSGEIVITGKTTACTVKVPGQTPVNNAVDYTNQGAGTSRDVLVTATVGTETMAAGKTGIKYTSSGGACGASGENGSYRGSVTTKGYSNSGHTTQVGVWVE